MTPERQDLEARLKRLEPYPPSARVHLLRGDDALRAVVERKEEAAARIRQVGHISATGVHLVRLDPKR